MRRRMIVGNWKMHGLRRDLQEIDQVAAYAENRCPAIDVALCVPATLIGEAVRTVAGRPLVMGGQVCHPQDSGAHTGDISAAMLADLGARLVIVGHSERRLAHGETSEVVLRQAMAALRHGLLPIICVGESDAQRRAGGYLAVISEQVAQSIPREFGENAFAIAYEPVWAIGTGQVATPSQIAEVHGHIRSLLHEIGGDAGAMTPILYGGSVSPANAGSIFDVPDVDGALVGGASLKAASFTAISEVALERAT